MYRPPSKDVIGGQASDEARPRKLLQGHVLLGASYGKSTVYYLFQSSASLSLLAWLHR